LKGGCINLPLFINNITKLRKSKGITEEDLARICNCSSKTIHNVETGKTSPNLKLAFAIKMALNAESIESLFDETTYW
jgi:putative transcriptional regulator